MEIILLLVDQGARVVILQTLKFALSANKDFIWILEYANHVVLGAKVALLHLSALSVLKTTTLQLPT